MKSIIPGSLILFVITFALSTTHAQDLPVRYIGIDQGLSNNAVTSIYQDRSGFMWFGTYDGLNRYDGYEFEVFRNIIGDSTSLHTNIVDCISGDVHDNIWVGTQKGVMVYDKARDHFYSTYYLPPGGRAPEKVTDNATKIRSINDKFMLVGTQHAGLIVFENNLKVGTQIPYAPTDKTATYMVSAMAYGGIGNLIWIFIQDKGLHQYNLLTKTFHLINNSITVARCLAFDKKGELWLANDYGLYKYSIADNSYSDSYIPIRTTAMDISVDKTNTLWIASDGTGIWTLPPGAASASLYLNSLGETVVNSNAVYSIYQDGKGRKWIGTLRGGVNMIEPTTNAFSHVFYNKWNAQSKIVEDFILSFCEDEKGNLWIGTDGAGLRYWNRSLDVYDEYKHESWNPKSISSNFVTKIVRDFNNDIWVSTWFSGVNRFNKKDHTFKRYTCFNPVTGLKEHNAWLVFEDSKKNLWASTTNNGSLYLFNRAEDKFELFDNNISNVLSLIEDADGTLWAGTFTSLIKIDQVEKKHRFYNVGYAVRSLHEDRQRNIWLGTQDGGLFVLNRNTEKFRRFTANDGLPNNSILGILEDDKNNLWLSTFKGISKLCIKNFSFHNFTESDGLQSNQFSFNAATVLSTGEFAFGGIKGFNIFYPDSIVGKQSSHELFITNINLNNVPIEKHQRFINERSGNQITKITLPIDSAVLSIDFIALEYSGNDKINYAYYLEGWDKGWNYVNKVRTANYSKLQEGTYEFKIKVTTPDGTWTEGNTLLKIVVLPPWYRTWWAYVLYALAVAFAFYKYIRYTKWSERLKYEIKLAHLENEKEKEVAEKKLSFFTNISHEFRTPLTLIIDPLDHLMRSNGRFRTDKNVTVAYRNARRLLSMVDQLMLFRKADSGHDDLKISKIDIAQLCKGVYNCFTQLATSRNIHFGFFGGDEPVEIYGDYEKLEIVFFNLLSNAFKFTPDNGVISLTIDESDNEVIIKVEDTGCGIAPDQQQRIYEKYNRGHSVSAFSTSGFGIGLYLVKYFIDCHEGKIKCNSELKKGTVFSVFLEKKNKQFNAQQFVVTTDNTNALLKELSANIDPVEAPAAEPYINGRASDELVTEKKSILLIDDNPEIIQYLQFIFKDRYLLFTANNGDDGFSLAASHAPDLVISDIHMTGMNGLDLCRKIKTSPALGHIPVIMLTASSADELKLRGIEWGADDYITKPFSSELLIAKVDNILKNRNLIQKYFFENITLKETTTKVPAEFRDFLERCIAVVEENIDKEDFNIAKFARCMGMSHSALYQKIKHVSGQSIATFVRSIRLRRAAVLMLRENLHVKEAAFYVGMGDVKYFREQFTKLFGMTPSEYIKRYRNSFNRDLNVVRS
jgi:signal transduction histidine kinase/ligand-binding sensor domain-containing protein/DNA-binding NarL/FixJ family response regulator